MTEEQARRDHELHLAEVRDNIHKNWAAAAVLIAIAVSAAVTVAMLAGKACP